MAQMELAPGQVLLGGLPATAAAVLARRPEWGLGSLPDMLELRLLEPVGVKRFCLIAAIMVTAIIPVMITACQSRLDCLGASFTGGELKKCSFGRVVSKRSVWGMRIRATTAALCTNLIELVS